MEEDGGPISIVDHPGWTFGQRINWLNTLVAAAVAYAGAATRYGDLADFVEENVQGLIRHECEVLGVCVSTRGARGQPTMPGEPTPTTRMC